MPTQDSNPYGPPDRHLHSGAWQGQPRALWHCAGHFVWPTVRGRRHRSPVLAAIDLQTAHVRPGPREVRARDGLAVRRCGTERRCLQRDQPAIRDASAAQRDDQRRGDHDHRAPARAVRRRDVRYGAGPPEPGRRPAAVDRPVGIRVGAAHRASQPGDRASVAELRHGARPGRGMPWTCISASAPCS